jgi:hypothetical protein
MKVTMLALALAALATTASAYASNPANTQAANNESQAALQWSAAQSTPHAKTRAEVRQELVRAQKDGQLAALNRFYQGS